LKKIYNKPQVMKYGKMQLKTMGGNSSSIDGPHSTQQVNGSN